MVGKVYKGGLVGNEMNDEEKIKRLEVAKKISSEESFKNHGYDKKLKELIHKS